MTNDIKGTAATSSGRLAGRVVRVVRPLPPRWAPFLPPLLLPGWRRPWLLPRRLRRRGLFCRAGPQQLPLEMPNFL